MKKNRTLLAFIVGALLVSLIAGSFLMARERFEFVGSDEVPDGVDEVLYTQEARFDECEILVEDARVTLVCGPVKFVSDLDDENDITIANGTHGEFTQSASYEDVFVEMTRNINGATRVEVRGVKM